MAERMLGGSIKDGDSVIIDIDASGQVTVLNGGETVTSNVVAQSTEPQMPAGIS